MANPIRFINQVQAELSKVVWPSRRETMISTGMVLVMFVLSMIFFLSADKISRLIIQFLLGLGG